MSGITVGMTTSSENYVIEAQISEPKFKLFFNGYELTLFFKKNKFTYPAVSGRPIEQDGKIIFDYSKERQKMANIGPIPEGQYFILPSEITTMNDLSVLDKALVDISTITTPFGLKLGSFPGGYFSWGRVRSRIYKEDSSSTTRDNFFIHGGAKAGSAGCIDLWKHNDEFFEKLKECLDNMPVEKIPLEVNYNNVSISCDANLNYRIVTHPYWGNSSIGIYMTDKCQKE